MNHSILVFDLEIVKAIQGRDDERVEGIEYCDGFDDKANMGISVLGAYDYLEDRYRVFCDDNKDDFIELARRRKMLVSWNGIHFDNPVIKEAWGPDIPPQMCYDLVRQVKIACGLEPDAIRKGYRLNDWAAENFGAGKTGDGAMAPIDWQHGKIGNVIDYCLADVWLTKQLMDRVLACGVLRNPNDGTSVALQPPWSVVNAG